MDTELIEYFSREADGIAARIRELNDHRFNQRLESEIRTIDIKVEKSANAKATELAKQKLEKSERWRQVEAERAKIYRSTLAFTQEKLFWLAAYCSRTVPGAIILSFWIVTSSVSGMFYSLNFLPNAVGCKSIHDLCYLLRIDKNMTLAPEVPFHDDNEKNADTGSVKKRSK